MTRDFASLWTIEELGAKVALALADQPDMPSGRVREVPDLRTIRYYTTLGLIDRAAEMRGRTALYGQRHLLQIVAIKRLQARGLSLTEVQQRLVGQSDAVLRGLAQLPAEDGVAMPAPEPRTDTFWREAPAAPEPPSSTVEQGDASLVWQGVPLKEGVLLLFEPARSMDEDDIAALRTAAAPLLKLLQARRLLRPHSERGTT